jgi:Family of unknown function (DUF6131)
MLSSARGCARSRGADRAAVGRTSTNTAERVDMIILGIILLILGFVLKVAILWTIGIIVLIVGLILMLLGATGRAIGGRRHYW